jgi:hypothetical protein
LKGIALVPGTIVQLTLDGTLVYVEDVQPTFAAVVALPEQVSTGGVFKPGCVGAKKISPYSQASRAIDVPELSERNRDFIGTFEALRKQHGPNFISRTPEEVAAMSVMKVTGTRKPRVREKKKPKREGRMYQKCVTCGEQPGHWDHGTGDGKHEFVAPPVEASAPATEKAPRVRAERPARATRPKGSGAYTLVSEDLTVARATPRGEKFAEGNRSHRVVLAIASLPNKTGTLEEVIAALVTDGKTPPANPLKVVKRALNQLTRAEFGSCVTREGGAPDVDDDAE